MHRPRTGHLVCLSVFSLVAAAGCGGETAPDAGNDAVSDDVIAALDSGYAAVDVTARDVTDSAAVCESLGCPCENDIECESGYCLDAGSEGRLCSAFSTDKCAAERFECRLLENTGGDAVRLCVPVDNPYCGECESALDCDSLLTLCVGLADGSRGCTPPLL
jgi:hypothetical protein